MLILLRQRFRIRAIHNEDGDFHCLSEYAPCCLRVFAGIDYNVGTLHPTGGGMKEYGSETVPIGHLLFDIWMAVLVNKIAFHLGKVLRHVQMNKHKFARWRVAHLFPTSLIHLINNKGGCPILALFARVGHDAAAAARFFVFSY